MDLEVKFSYVYYSHFMTDMDKHLLLHFEFSYRIFE